MTLLRQLICDTDVGNWHIGCLVKVQGGVANPKPYQLKKPTLLFLQPLEERCIYALYIEKRL